MSWAEIRTIYYERRTVGEVRLPNKTVVRFDYYLIKLKHLDYRTFLPSRNPLAYALMAKMNYNRKERVRLKPISCG